MPLQLWSYPWWSNVYLCHEQREKERRGMYYGAWGHIERNMGNIPREAAAWAVIDLSVWLHIADILSLGVFKHLLVARKIEWAGAGLTVHRWPTGGIAIITREAGITVWACGVVRALLEETGKLSWKKKRTKPRSADSTFFFSVSIKLSWKAFFSKIHKMLIILDANRVHIAPLILHIHFPLSVHGVAWTSSVL